MSGSNRGNSNKARLIGGALVALLGIAAYWSMFYSMGFQSGQNERKANVESAHYASDTAEQIERECSAVTGQSARECITEIVYAERESQRGEQDLAAQWKSADWVMWAGVLAGAQALATIIGLYYVRETLGATLKAVEDTSEATEAMRDANEIAKEAIAVGNRAWLKIVPTFDSDFQRRKTADVYDEETWGATFNVLFENIGNSPALQVHSSIRMFMPWPGQPSREALLEETIAKAKEEAASSARVNILPSEQFNRVLPGWIDPQLFEMAWAGFFDNPKEARQAEPLKFQVWIAVVAVYRIIRDPPEAYRTVSACFDVCQKDVEFPACRFLTDNVKDIAKDTLILHPSSDVLGIVD